MVKLNWDILICMGMIFMLISCEKMIDIDLNEVRPAIVIEAELSSTSAMLEVKISRTTSYFDTDEPEWISGAMINLSDDSGTSISVPEMDQGIYRVEDLNLQFGETYMLTVETGGESYQAQSTLHQPVKIKSLEYYYESGQSFFDQGYYLRLFFTDPTDEDNYYRIKIYKNGRLQNDAGSLILFSDSYMEGKDIEISLRRTMFREGSLARVEFITLDKKAYDFLRTFDELLSTNPGSAAPANPISNFSNGALGYFSAWSSDEAILTITP